MTTAPPPRWQVLREADRIIEDGLLGRTEDKVLQALASAKRVTENRERVAREIRESWQRFRMSPFFKLYCFYLFVILASWALGMIQKKAQLRTPRMPSRRPRQSST